MGHEKIGLIFMSVVLVTGCGGSGVNFDYPTRRGEITPSGVRLGGVFRMNEEGTPRSLDPVRIGDSVSHHIGQQIFDSVLTFDDDLELRPGIAESYELSGDGLVYTFKIRSGVRFQDDPCFPGGRGREVTAHDVAYSLTRNLIPANLSTGVWLFDTLVEGAKEFLEGQADHVSGFRVLDDSTFQIRLKKPFAPFPYRLAMSYCFVVPREAVEHYGQDFFQHPVGTGPFRFAYWKPNQELLLVRNLNYWQKDADGVPLPYLDAIRISFINDLKIAFLEFDLGNLDFVQEIHDDIWSKVFDETGRVRPAYQKYQIDGRLMWITQYYGFNLTKPPFKDNRALRQAFNYAIDRESLIKYVLNGRGEAARGVVPPNMPGYTSRVEGYPFNLEKARKLMAQAGYPNGEGLGEITLQLNSAGTLNENVAEAVQEQLSKIGVKVQLRVVDWSQHLESLDNYEPVFFRMAWVADWPEPENFLALLYGSNLSPAGPNHTAYANPEFDRCYEQAIATPDEAERYALYQQAEQIAVEDAPWLFLYNTKRYNVRQPYVRNMRLNAQELMFLTQVWLDEP
ncbi:MAG TPA: ABC transporter substrate-binding protein [bacterium]|nr:ABC transporter substrate-binding protein [bacterium]